MDRIGKFVVHKAVVPSGGARVLFCHDPDLGLPVAVKLFQPRPDGLLSPAQQLDRFLTEARLLASFDHPHIVAVKGLDRLPDGRPFFVMPFQPAQLGFEIGRDFDDPAAEARATERDRPRPLAPARALTLLRQVALGLYALHRRGMVHRALRPSNVLLTAREGGGARLCDFAWVKQPGRADLPLPETWQGDPHYTAPEQLDSATTVGPPADLFAWGRLAARMLTGRLTPVETTQAALAALPGLPAGLVDLLAACLDPDPAARPPQAGAALEALATLPPAVASPRPAPQVTSLRRPGPPRKPA